MNIWAENITNGFELYFKFFPLMLFVTFIFILIRKGTVRPAYFFGAHCFVLYLICLIELVLFPLPTVEKIAGMNGYNGQFIPFNFLYDILKDRSILSVLQIILNIVMTIPFGFFLKFFLNMKRRNIIILTFLLSLIIEVAQLTGLFFTYPGSYRVFDVDDLIANTIGGFVGTVLANNVKSLLPDFDRMIDINIGSL